MRRRHDTIGPTPAADGAGSSRRLLSRRRTRRLAGAVLLAAPVTALTLVFPTTATQAATPPTPTYGTATVDGDPSEWDLANDFYAAMYNGGRPTDPVLADGYLRYDCTSGTLFVMVDQASYDGALVPLLNASGNAWAYLNGNQSSKVYSDASGTNPSHTPPEFEWFGTGYDGDSSHSQGYEASFAISPGSYTIVVHVEALYSGSASTAGFVGFNTRATSETVSLDIPDSCTNSGGGDGGGGGGGGGGGDGGGGGSSNPSIAVTKYLDGTHYSAAPGAELPVGSTIDWTYDVTNTGDVDLSSVGVVDDQGVLVDCPGSTLPVGQSETCGGSSHATAGSYENTATASGTATDSTVVTAQDSSFYYGVSDGSLSGPTPTDPAVTSFSRDYGWNISKGVNTTSATIASGAASFDYTVQAAETGFTDSAWELTGDVTLTNPNAVDLTGVTVTDTVDNGGTCGVVNGTNVTIPASSDVTLDYNCTWASAPSASSGTDSAVATWDPVANHTPGSSAEVDTPFAFGSPTTVTHGTATVTDSLQGTLGTLHATDATPYASGTYTYTLNFAAPSSGCQDHGNTATIVETGQGDSRQVSVCRASSSGGGGSGGGSSSNGPQSNSTPDPDPTNTPTPDPANTPTPDPANPPVPDPPAPIAQQTPIPGVTEVHAGMVWAGSRPYELVATALGAALIAIGIRRRRKMVSS